MACCSEPGTETKGGGGCCGGQRPFPWLSALRDPVMLGLFFRRFWRELLLGLLCGGVTGLAALFFSDALGPLGPLLGGPWLHFHAGAVLPAAILAGLVLAVGSGNGAKDRFALSGWALAILVLGGIANGFLELGEAGHPSGLLAAFFQEGGYASALVLGLLGLPASWLAWGAVARAKRPRTCH